MRKICLKFFAITFMFVSCSDNELLMQGDSAIDNGMKSISVTPGDAHNAMIDRYYENYENVNNPESFDFIVSIIDDELTEMGASVTFGEILDEYFQIRTDLEELISYGQDIEEIYAFFDRLRDEEISTSDQHFYSIKLLKIHEDYEGNVELFNSKLDEYESEISENVELSSSFKENFLDAASVSRASHYYWYEENMSRGHGGFIAGADAAGAVAVIQTGAVATGSLVGGPWGGFAVLVGGAALSSIMAAR